MTLHARNTNGASLEDCHTNFFALTELCGIKWRKLIWSGSGGSEPLEDPVLSSYSRCLAGDVLCVWRRASQPQQQQQQSQSAELPPAAPLPAPPPPLSLRAPKELWIFWYGEEPDLAGLVAPELIASEGDQGSWESGLSYECRSLLFKALHNLIERCLLSRDFVRLGKWFVQPYDGDEEDVAKSCWHLSFSFAFFMHGESTVCASVDVRQHPPVRRLARMRPDSHNTKVILAPFGLAGNLITSNGNGCNGNTAPTDPSSARLLDAWHHFYPPSSLGNEPATVEVTVGGARMRYPAGYVLLTEMDDVQNSSSVPPSLISQYLPPKSSAVLSNRTLTELAIGQQEIENGCNDSNLDVKPNLDIKPTKEWNFVDPTRRTSCSCSKCINNLTEHGTPGGGSPGSCSGLSPLPPTSAGGPASCGTLPILSSSPQPPLIAPSTPRTAAAPILMPHTPAPTPPPLHHPNTPRNTYNQNSVESPSECLKRPILALQEPEPDSVDEDRPLDLLYDYSTLHAWLNHPVKKFKQDEGNAVNIGINVEAGAYQFSSWEEPTTWRRGEDLYAGHNHTKMAPIDPQPCNGSLLSHIKMENNQEANQDDANKENKNLFTSNGLQPSYKDLEQIFDNSDDTSGDETLVHTPPDSNKSISCCLDDGSGTTILNGIGGNITRTNSRACPVRAEDLGKMFPTPPSLEHNPQSSPGAFNLPEPEQPSLHLRCGSPPDEPIEDWSYVFKPPTICKYVGSSKYSSLSGLSNTVPPPHCVYRPSWQHQQTAPEPRSNQRPSAPRTPHPLGNLHSVGTISQPASVGGVSGIGSAPPPPIAATPSPASSIPPSPPACALLLNLLLTDTALNIFRDHNFDSCTMCVCNAGPKVVGNIRGADSGVYLSGGGGSPASPDSNLGVQSPIPALGSNGLLEEEPIRCTCGFSAVVNRRLAHRAGLFYEDEMEITGVAGDPAEHKREGGAFSDSNKNYAASLVELVREQCGVLGNVASALHLAAAEAAERAVPEPKIHLLEYNDCGEAAALALEAAAGRAAHAVHYWPFLRVPAPSCGRDVVRVMRRLQPLLQEAMQKKCSTRGMWDAVVGPLTWRQFHRLASRGTDDLCEPQPVPPLLVGHDRDWVALSPHAIHLWDKLLLEPYSYSRDVGYIALVPDNSALIPKVKNFFRDLSTAYEQCRLGRHAPVTRISRDGLLRVPRTARNEPLDDWFNSLPDSTTSEILKLYAQICRGVLGPALSNVQLDRTLLDGEGSGGARPPPPATPTERPAPSPMAPPSTPDHPATPTASHNDHEADNSNSSGNMSIPIGSCLGENTSNDDDEGSAPCIVVYLVEPTLGEDRRTSCLAMLRCAASLLQILPEHIRSSVTVQMVSAESISEIGSAGAGMGTVNGRTVRRSSQLRSLALSVFSQCRRQLVHSTNIKSLTGFGTAANADIFLKNKDEKNRMPYRLYVPPYVLAPPRPLKDIAETFGQAAPESCSVLYLSYCLSADQSWLLAAATDSRGELLETCTINVDVPARLRRRRAPPARRLGLTKLMEFTLGVMSQSVQPWRLVVGRIGRIGHGELKGWSWLLSRKNLLKASTQLRDVCTSCGLMYPGGAPCILSACLVSTEPDSALRLMADQFTPDERFSQNAITSQLSTPQDGTCTHILVFPTSATTQSSQSAFQHINGPDIGDDFFPALNDDDMTEGIDGMNDFIMSNDIFNAWSSGIPSPTASPKREGDEASRPGSPGRSTGNLGRQSPLSDDGNTRCGGSGGWEEVGALLQQPLALGYLVSTAPLGKMPKWWWAACPHAASACPAFLKNALHLHSPTVQQNSDDLLQQPPSSSPQHPLDSHYTTDVLRYVLEGYNALSWLALDCNTQDRLSCLPSHVQVLMQLYHLSSALV